MDSETRSAAPSDTRPRPPSGAVCLMFTDIESHTRLWHEIGEGFKECLDRHYAEIRASLAEHGGYEVSSEGDSLFAAFADAARALLCARDIQRRMARIELPGGRRLQVRIGLHLCEPLCEGGDYYGYGVSKAARISSAAHGGQVLASAETLRGLAAPSDGWTARPLGNHRLRGLVGEHALVEIAGVDAEDRPFPPPNTLTSYTLHNIPAPAGSFIGRERLIDEVASLLSSPGRRLVTLVGIGGIGKTSVSLQIAERLVSAFEDGVWFFDLTQEPEAAAITRKIEAETPLCAELRATGAENLDEALRSANALLVLDNLETVIGADEEVGRLLRLGPGLRILATSRRALAIAGETVCEVPPMESPADVPPHRLLENEAVSLFVERARDRIPGWTPSADDLPVIRDICIESDALPLSLELAAARASVLSLPEILSGFGERFALLRAGRGARFPVRQMSLLAVVSWSVDLLSDAGKRVFAAASVFAPGFTLEALGKLAPDLDRSALLDALEDLSSLGLLSRATGGKQARYAMLPSLREYGLGMLSDEDAARAAHAEHYLSLLDIPEDPARGSFPTGAYRGLGEDLDNIRAALRWVVELGPSDERLAYCVAMYYLGVAQATLSGSSARTRSATVWLDIVEACRRALEASGKAVTPLKCRARLAAGRALSHLGRLEEALSEVGQARQDALSVGAHDLAALGFEYEGMSLLDRGLHERALPVFQAAYALHEERGDLDGLVWALHSMSVCHWRLGHIRTAYDSFTRGIAWLRQAGDDEALGDVAAGLHVSLASACLLLGRYDEAHASLAEAQTAAERTHDAVALGHLHHVRAAVLHRQGKLDDCERSLREALDMTSRVGMAGTQVEILYLMGCMALERGAPDEAQEALQHARALVAEEPVDDAVTCLRILEARVLRAAGDHAKAHEIADAALAGAALAASAHWRAELETVAGWSALGCGDAEGAREHFARAVARAREHEMPYRLAEALHGLALALGDPSPHALEAESVAKAIGALALAEQIQSGLPVP